MQSQIVSGWLSKQDSNQSMHFICIPLTPRSGAELSQLRRHVVEKVHENFYASNIFLSDGNRLAPDIHGRRPKGSVRSC
jgi:hypothetical protein